MVIVKLWGGLGNQMFQYAYGYQVAQKVNTNLILDTSWFDACHAGRIVHRDPEILKFGIGPNEVINAQERYPEVRLLSNRLVNIIIRIPPYAVYRVNGMKYVKESRFHYQRSLAGFHENGVYLDGYWQCPKYFDRVAEDLRKMYIPLNLSDVVLKLGDKLRNENTTAVHIRRGDYPTKKIWYSRLIAITDDYYKAAFRYMQENNKETAYYTFSNDIEGAKSMIENILGHHVSTFSELKLSANEEWYLLSCCQNQIIGNSTFSWWAAYVNANPKKVVITPDGYMGNDDIIPFDWHKIR